MRATPTPARAPRRTRVESIRGGAGPCRGASSTRRLGTRPVTPLPAFPCRASGRRPALERDARRGPEETTDNTEVAVAVWRARQSAPRPVRPRLADAWRRAPRGALRRATTARAFRSSPPALFPASAAARRYQQPAPVQPRRRLRALPRHRLAGCEDTESDIAARVAAAVSESPPPASAGRDDALALYLYDNNGNGRITCVEARRHGNAPVRCGHPRRTIRAGTEAATVSCASSRAGQSARRDSPRPPAAERQRLRTAQRRERCLRKMTARTIPGVPPVGAGPSCASVSRTRSARTAATKCIQFRRAVQATAAVSQPPASRASPTTPTISDMSAKLHGCSEIRRPPYPVDLRRVFDTGLGLTVRRRFRRRTKLADRPPGG